jgi:hypothetical protein
MAHVLQLAVKSDLTKSPIVKSTISRISDSPKLLEKLRECCSRANIQSLEPVLDVDTRWNSTWEMVDCAIRLREAIDDLLRRIRQRHDGFTDLSISPTERMAGPITLRTWAVASRYCNFLLPFKEATTLLSSASYPTLSMLVPIYWIAKRHMVGSIVAEDLAVNLVEQVHAEEQGQHQVTSDRDDEIVEALITELYVDDSSSNTEEAEENVERDPAFVAFARAIMDKLKAYEHCVETKEAKIAAALDPRIKRHLATYGLSRGELTDMLVDEYNNNYRDKYEALLLKEGYASSHGHQSGIQHNSVSVLSRYLAQAQQAEQQEDADASFLVELSEWFTRKDGLEVSAPSATVFEWFRVHGATYPRI